MYNLISSVEVAYGILERQGSSTLEQRVDSNPQQDHAETITSSQHLAWEYEVGQKQLTGHATMSAAEDQSNLNQRKRRLSQGSYSNLVNSEDLLLTFA